MEPTTILSLTLAHFQPMIVAYNANSDSMSIMGDCSVVRG